MCFVALKAWSNQLQAGLFYLTFWGCQTQGLLSFFFWLWASCYLTENHYLGIPGMLACLPPLCGFEAEALLWLYSILRWQTQIPGWMDCPLDSRLQEEPYSTLRDKQNFVRNFEMRELGFLVLSALSVFLIYPFLSPLSLTFGSWKSHHCTPSVSPSSNLPLGRFCIFYQTLLVPGFCIFILNS